MENIQSGIGDKVAIFLQHFTTFISGSVVGFVYNWKLALVVYTVLPIISVLGVVLTKVFLLIRTTIANNKSLLHPID